MKMKKKTTTKKKVVAKSTKTTTRLMAVMLILMKSKKISIKRLVQQADKLYGQRGGKSNIAETKFYVSQLTKALQAAALLIIEDGLCERKW
jgi:hypothetical protein